MKKIIIVLFGMLLCLTTVQAMVNDSIYAVWTMDNNLTTGTSRGIDGSLQVNNISLILTPITGITTNKLGEAYSFGYNGIGGIRGIAVQNITGTSAPSTQTWLNNLDTQSSAISAWVNFTTINGNNDIITMESAGDQFYFGRSIGANTLRCGWFDGTNQISPSCNTFPSNTWFLLTCNYWINGTVEIYYNATLCASQDGPASSIADFGQGLTFGGRWITPSTFNRGMNGTITQMVMWSKGLNKTEVQQLWNNGSGQQWSFLNGTTSCSPSNITIQTPINETAVTNLNITGTASDECYAEICNIGRNDTRWTWNGTFDNWQLYNNTPVSEGYYSVNVWTSCPVGDNATMNVSFMYDTGNPLITYVNPTANGTRRDNGFLMNLNCYDANLFQFGALLKNTTQTLNYWNYVNLAPTTANITQTITYQTGNYTIQANCSDGHTMNNIDDLKVDLKANKMTFTYKDDILIEEYIPLTSTSNLVSLNYERKDDRISEIYSFDKESTSFTRRITCNQEIIEVTNSKYPNHIICGDIWMDTESDSSNTTISKLDSLTYEFQTTTYTPSLSFKSVGVINRVYEDKTFWIDTTIPTWNQTPANPTLSYNLNGFYTRVNATDNAIFGLYSANDSTRFFINESNGSIWNNTKLTVGTYNLLIMANDSANNTVTMTMIITVNKGTASVRLLLNSSRRTLNMSSEATIQANASIESGEETTLKIYRDGNLVTMGNMTHTFAGLTIDRVGYYNITAIAMESSLYFESYETWYVNYSYTNELQTFQNPKSVWANLSNGYVFGWISQDGNLTYNRNLYINGSVFGCVKTLYETIGVCI